MLSVVFARMYALHFVDEETEVHSLQQQTFSVQSIRTHGQHWDSRSEQYR